MRNKLDGYLDRLFRGPMVDWFQTPLRRRSVAIGVMLIHVATAGSLGLLTLDIVWPLIPAGIAAMYLMGMLNMSTRGIFELKEERLDEYQIALRDSAFRRAYYFSLIWIILTAPLMGLVIDSEHSLMILIVYIMLGFSWGMALPRVIVAWTQPADTAEDE